MPWLFASGVAADIILVVIAIEALWLRLRGRWQLIAIASRLMPGALMMMALQAALTQQQWPWIALPLALSFPFHLLDLRYGPGRRARK